MATKRKVEVSQIKHLTPLDLVLEFTSVHPVFHESFKSLCNTIFTHSGPFCLAHRHYIAIMAATRHNCDFLVEYHKAMYLRCNGDSEWLKGLNHADIRFGLLDELNRYMAHQPWMISADLIQKLVGRGTPDAEKTFTLTELNHAAIIMSVVHNMVSFIRAINLDNKQIELVAVSLERFYDDDAVTSSCEVEKILNHMDRMDKFVTKPTSPNCASFDLTGGESPESPSEEEDSSNDGLLSFQPQYGYVDFQKRSDKNVKDFKIHEFTWDHSFNVISEFAYESASSVDAMIDHIHKLTYNFIGKFGDIDTTKYRLAVWNYIQLIFGIKHDDYNYSNTNLLMDRQTKTYIKNTACFPQRVNDDYLRCMHGFKDSEKLHVVIIVFVARMESQLLHFGRALCNYNSRTMAKKGYRRPLD